MSDWIIRHPGGLGMVECESFEECLRWYEGFNLPRKMIDGESEPFADSNERMKQYHLGDRGKSHE